MITPSDVNRLRNWSQTQTRALTFAERRRQEQKSQEEIRAAERRVGIVRKSLNQTWKVR